MQYVSVRSVASRLKSQFKVDMDIYDVVQSCADALKKMGVIALNRTGFIATIENFNVNLPGTVWKVRGVIRLDGVTEAPFKIIPQDIYFPPQEIFTFEEANTTPLKPTEFKDNYLSQFKGPYIDYTWDCPYLRFNETGIPVAVECTSIKTDEEGYPMIPETSFYGCLYYSLFVYHQPLFLLGQTSPQIMKTVEEWKDNNIAQANSKTLLTALTSNERDKLFNIMSSMDRKTFNLPS